YVRRPVVSISLFEPLASPRDLHSFPTRRSSDLLASLALRRCAAPTPRHPAGSVRAPWPLRALTGAPRRAEWNRAWSSDRARARRSEEHTSELQSRENLVCRLLLEKKKTTTEQVE